jgi:leucyl/phenylalanyl-tRNA--protein transferase
LELDLEILAALSPRNLLLAYCQGVFPMVEEGRLTWFSPDPRGLLPLDDRFHVSRRLARTVRSRRFLCTVNRRFDEVVRLCADRPDTEGTWISPEMRVAYGAMHQRGLAHSVEAWPAGEAQGDSPAGGLYGLAIGGAFFAESMFHARTDAGKVALVHLVERLRRRGFVLCDVQWTTDHLRSFGAFEVPREDYLGRLLKAVTLDCRFA